MCPVGQQSKNKKSSCSLMNVETIINADFRCFDAEVRFDENTTPLKISFTHMEVVEWSARLPRKGAFRIRRLLAPLSMMHIPL